MKSIELGISRAVSEDYCCDYAMGIGFKLGNLLGECLNEIRSKTPVFRKSCIWTLELRCQYDNEGEEIETTVKDAHKLNRELDNAGRLNPHKLDEKIRDGGK